MDIYATGRHLEMVLVVWYRFSTGQSLVFVSRFDVCNGDVEEGGAWPPGQESGDMNDPISVCFQTCAELTTSHNTGRYNPGMGT